MPTTDSLAFWQPRLIAMLAVPASGVDGGAHDDGAHDLNHLHRVWRVARTLLETHPDADALVVQAACYLHDIVNLPKNHPARAQASRMAAALALERLRAAGFPDDKLAGVAHAIEAHSFSAAIAPRTIEAMLVQDADRLDALGAVGLARLYYTAGRMGSALAHPAEAGGSARTLNDRAYALDHIEVKLATLPTSMRTAAGRALGERRLAWLRAFRETFLEEWGSE